MPCIGDFYWLIKFTERLLESRREKVVVSVLAMNAAAFFLVFLAESSTSNWETFEIYSDLDCSDFTLACAGRG